MVIKELLIKSKQIWCKENLTLSQIIVRIGKVLGDICCWERNSVKDTEAHTEGELKKELGNLIFSTIKWCDELGYDPEECIQLAAKSQEESVNKLKS